MGRLIDADALKRDVKRWFAATANRERMKEALDSAPTIEAEPVRHGRWIDKQSAIHYIVHSKCSACGSWQGAYWMNFCPECGAKMDGGADDQTG